MIKNNFFCNEDSINETFNSILNSQTYNNDDITLKKITDFFKKSLNKKMFIVKDYKNILNLKNKDNKLYTKNEVIFKLYESIKNNTFEINFNTTENIHIDYLIKSNNNDNLRLAIYLILNNNYTNNDLVIINNDLWLKSFSYFQY